MKVSELIGLLKELPQDATVLVARDQEGNGFNEFGGYSDGWWDGEDYYGNDEDFVEYGDPDSDAAVVLWP